MKWKFPPTLDLLNLLFKSSQTLYSVLLFNKSSIRYLLSFYQGRSCFGVGGDSRSCLIKKETSRWGLGCTASQEYQVAVGLASWMHHVLHPHSSPWASELEHKAWGRQPWGRQSLRRQAAGVQVLTRLSLSATLNNRTAPECCAKVRQKGMEISHKGTHVSEEAWALHVVYTQEMSALLILPGREAEPSVL